MIDKRIKRIPLTLIFLGILAVWSCQSKKEFASNEEMRAYILDQENGLTQEREQQGIKVNVSVWPKQILFDEKEGIESKDSTIHFLITLSSARSFGVDVYTVSKFGDLFKLSTASNTQAPRMANFQLLKPNIIQGLLAFDYERKEGLDLLIKGMGSKPISMNFLKEDLIAVLD